MGLLNLRNALMAGKRLPYDAEVEYLESTGTQYIDTGVTPDFNLSMSATLCKADTTTGFLFGARQANATNSFCLASFLTYARFDFGGTGGGSGQTNISPICDGNMHTISVAYPIITVDGTAGNMASVSSFSLNQNIVLFANNTNGSITKYSGVRIAALKLYSNASLARDFIPVRKGTVGYLYDRVSGKLFGNAGTGDFVLGPDVVPVEYIESHGTEYIDTGIYGDNNMVADLEFAMTDLSTGDAGIFGARSSWASAQFGILRVSTSNGKFWMAYGASNSDATKTADVYGNTADWHRAHLAENWSIDNYSAIATPQEFTTPATLKLFASYLAANLTWYANMKARSLVLSKSGTDVLKLLPVRVGTEGAMMDILTRRIYRNAGTGAFTYGNDLKYPIPAS